MALPFLKKSKRAKKISRIEKKIREYIRSIYTKDLLFHLEETAMRETIDYIKQHMSDSMIFTRWHDLHQYAFEQVTVNGLFMEFGVKKGDTLRELADMTDKTIHGFDSFKGLPEDWTGTQLRKGRFSKQGKLPRVPDNVELHAGWFDQSLPEFLKVHNQPVAYMHIDCDLYSSTRTILDCLAEQIVPGTVIVFDEYFNYPNWQQHEYRAMQEFSSKYNINYKYLGFYSHDSCVAIQIVDKQQD